MTTAMHADCLPCRAKANEEGLTPQDQMVATLLMYELGQLDSAKRDLCFAHRRQLDNAMRACEAEERTRR